MKNYAVTVFFRLRKVCGFPWPWHHDECKVKPNYVRGNARRSCSRNGKLFLKSENCNSLYKIINIHLNKAHAFLWLCALMNVRFRSDAQPSRPSVLYLVKYKLRIF